MPHRIVATRRSALALAQTRAFIKSLQEHHSTLSVEELLIVTSGDRFQDRPLAEIGGKGLFVREIEEALLQSNAHLAVHSMKDLPGHLPDGLSIVCVPERADPRDMLLVHPKHAPPNSKFSLNILPKFSKIGSSSLRRRVGLLRQRSDLTIVPLRGNVDTRLKKLIAGEYDAIVIAAAGLARLGLTSTSLPPHTILEIEELLPAVAQGVLAIEGRENDVETHNIVAALEHTPSRIAAFAERGVLKALGADCTMPLAAHARWIESANKTPILHMQAWVSEADGSQWRFVEETAAIHSVDEAENLGQKLGSILLRK